MTFYCLCMSPAIDATVRLPCAPKGGGEIFKEVAEDENVGGKAVNVARWLAMRGARVVCGGLLGEDNDRPFVRELSKYGIEDRFLRVAGATRRNEMITWPGGSMKINRPAFPGLSKDFDCMAAAERLAGDSGASGATVIISGSLPSALPAGFYARAVAYFKSLGWKTVLDASGEAMRLGLEAGPDLIKPNAEECEPLVGFVPKTQDEFAEATRLLRRKAGLVVISAGASGAWFDGEFVAAPEVDVVDTTAAGDTLLAEYCWSGDAAWAVAAGSAACTMPGGAPPPIDVVHRLKEGA